MLNTKLFEIRDRGTFLPIMATKLMPCLDNAYEAKRERYLLSRTGFRNDEFVMLCKINAEGFRGDASYDEFTWNSRTLAQAHSYIIKNWFALKSGDVIDVEFILGETSMPKQSEQVDDERGN